MKLYKLHEAQVMSEMLEPDTGPDGSRIDGKPEMQTAYGDLDKRVKQVEDAAKSSLSTQMAQNKEIEQKLSNKDAAPPPAKGIVPQGQTAQNGTPGGTPRPAASF